MLRHGRSRHRLLGRHTTGGRTLTVLLALVVVTARAASAQRVRGILADSATREPVGGAIVTLSDGKGAFLAHAVSAPGGAVFGIRFEATRMMRVARIGFKPRDLVVASADSIVDLRLQPIAPLLPVVTARANAVCKAGPETDATLELWEQA